MLVPHHGGSVWGVLSARFRGGIGQFEGVFVSFCELSFYSDAIFKMGANPPPPEIFIFMIVLSLFFNGRLVF